MDSDHDTLDPPTPAHTHDSESDSDKENRQSYDRNEKAKRKSKPKRTPKKSNCQNRAPTPPSPPPAQPPRPSTQLAQRSPFQLRNPAQWPTEGSSQKRRESPNPLNLGPRKKPTKSHPFTHHGRHFARTVYTFANINALLVFGLQAMQESGLAPDGASSQQRRDVRICRKLFKMIPGLVDRLKGANDESFNMMAALTGCNSARSNDTKGLKGSILDWITPPGESLSPPIPRNNKSVRGFNHPRTGQLLCPATLDWSDLEIRQQLQNKSLIPAPDDWPIFLYQDYKLDPEDPWKGLLRGELLVKGFRHIFLAPSSVDSEGRATRAGNARLHNMTSVTAASIAYVATQVRFALSSASTFNRSDKELDSEAFYITLLDLLEDPDEKEEITSLIDWWNQQVFPGYTRKDRPVPKDSLYGRIKDRRKALQARIIEPPPLDDGASPAASQQEGDA
ncbi:hypothetical protein CC2G_002584 [Coprinopsis cinerea AmutBmut pab1-1]|nr:hypothetical protein CC2G_002584 [Coprinopsis cinerea AmutBmut pab1-1]